MPEKRTGTIARTAFGWLLVAQLAACSPAGEMPAEVPVGGREAAAAEGTIDLIVAGDYVVVMDEDMTVIEQGAVAIDDGLILAVGPEAAITSEYPESVERLAGNGRLVMPGLINGHTHAAMTLLRGIADDLELITWLNDYIFPAEVAFVDAEFVRIGTELACWEMIRGGTTTFVDMYYHPDTVASVVDSCGLRAYVSATVIGQRSPDAEGAADALDKGQAFISRWQGRVERITPIFAPHSNYTLDEKQLLDARAAADRAGVPISIHLAESPFEIGYSRQHYGTTSIEFLNSIGFFDGPTIGAHVVWPTDEEIPILAERRVGVIHNPTSNMKLSSGISPVTEMLQAGIEVGLGTDGAASNNDLDMWEEMRLAAFLQKVDRMDPTALPAAAVLRMATSGGARAIGLGEHVGVLAPGMRADLIQVSLNDVHFVPTYDPISHLVYVADEQDVVTTVVDGRILMRNREILTVDTARVRREAMALAARIMAELDERLHRLERESGRTSQSK